MHRVAVLASDTVVAFELATVVQIFGSANDHAGTRVYEVGVVGPGRPVTTTTGGGPAFSLTPDHPVEWADAADTVVVPAHGSFLERPSDEVCVALTMANARGARLASLCRGSFILGAAGVLDGRTVNSHWAWASELAERYPSVRVQSEKLFVRDGNVYTAAGGTAALDLSLHLIERDHGAGLAAATARGMVAPMRRDGGQAQVIHYDVPHHGSAVRRTLNWAEQHLHDDLTLTDLARHAHMSTRTLTRRFREIVGTTPIDWLLRTRVRRAQELLENTTWTIDRISRVCGFRSVEALRYHFGRVVAVRPSEYRRSFDRLGSGPGLP